jgi:hypothetical protein
MSYCPVCERRSANLFRNIEGYDFFNCPECDSIFLQREFIDQIDGGRPTRVYDESYWETERQDAWHRSWGMSLARSAEAMLYARRPIDKFVDIATGPGFLLDSLATYLPASRSKFFGVEAFPPDPHTDHENYIACWLSEVRHKFDAGVCIEVVEHLTPRMLRNLAQDLARTSNEESFYLFNTGLSHFVRAQEPQYLDATRRGHIMSYSLAAIRMIFEPAGFTVREIRGKPWTFTVEYQSSRSGEDEIVDRIWTPCAENKAMLHDPKMGWAMYIMGLDGARAYLSG